MSKLLKQLKQQLEEKDKALEEKDKEIANLNFALRVEKDYYTNSYKQNERLKNKLETITNYNQDLEKENAQLKQQLAEKDELLKQKISKMKSTDFIKMCVDCGFMVQAKEIDNQTAIAVLEKVQKYIVEDAKPTIGYPYLKNSVMILNFVCDQIKSLKGEPKC